MQSHQCPKGQGTLCLPAIATSCYSYFPLELLFIPIIFPLLIKFDIRTSPVTATFFFFNSTVLEGAGGGNMNYFRLQLVMVDKASHKLHCVE